MIGTIIRSIYQDKNGKFLIGTNNGLTIMYKINDEFIYENFQYQALNINSLSGNYITTISEDDDNNIWIGTQNNGITIFQYSDKKFTRLEKKTNYGSKLINNKIRIIKKRRNGEIWIGTQEGINVINRSKNNYQYYG